MNARRLVAAVAVLAVVVAGLGITIAVLTAKPQTPVAAQPSPPPPPRPQLPTPAEFQLGVVVTEQTCSVPAGCVYKYRVEPKYLGLHPLPENEIKVIYQVTGGHQPQTGDFTVQGGQARVLENVPIEGPPGARLQASVTQIVGQ
ncbi:hypothetical protein A5662_03890 [Mycobacteriaceae bacterium 1482268.1]|nr:hypothetical protein A5662_03890 [Mycobacteriaceae bacterium 1482268.1]